MRFLFIIFVVVFVLLFGCAIPETPVKTGGERLLKEIENISLNETIEVGELAQEPLPKDLTLTALPDLSSCELRSGETIWVCSGNSDAYYQFGLSKTGSAYNVVALVDCSTPAGGFRLNEEGESAWGQKLLSGENNDLLAGYRFEPFVFDDDSGSARDVKTNLPKGTAVKFVLKFNPKKPPFTAYCDVNFVSRGDTIYSTSVRATFKNEED